MAAALSWRHSIGAAPAAASECSLDDEITITFGGFKPYGDKEAIARWAEAAIKAHMGERANFVRTEPYGGGRFRSKICAHAWALALAPGT